MLPTFNTVSEKSLANLSCYEFIPVYDGNLQTKGFRLLECGQYGDIAEASALRAGMTIVAVDNQGRVLARKGNALFLFRCWNHTHAGQVAIVEA